MKDEPERHAMEFVATRDSGMDEWYCPTCGRRFLLQMQPDYKSIILEPGDESSLHSGGLGGLQLPAPRIYQGEDNALSDDPYLAPWKNWLDQVDLDNLWKNKD